MQGQSSTETEIKLRLRDRQDGEMRLQAAGFQPIGPRTFESNTVFDTPGLALRTQDSLLRLRQAGETAIVTFKGPGIPGKHKSREELEFRVSDLPTCRLVLERLGFNPVFRYEKYRTEYQLDPGMGYAMLDETPIGTFLELEGTPDWIDHQAIRLGFAEKDYITASYGRLYLEHCAQNGLAPGDMLAKP